MTDTSWVGRTLAGRYRLTSPIGAGGMGAVFRAIQEPLGREVAVKVLKRNLDHDDEARRRFEREAQTLARLSHASIVVLHDFGQTDDGELFLVMEAVPGHPLRELLQSHGALPWQRAAAIADHIARGLRAAHAENVVHGDLKPENVMLHRPSGEAEQAKLLDFGLAKLAGGDAPGVTEVGIIVGTPRYLSPERVKGEREDPRSDLYSLGIMLFEMLTGHVPFEAPTSAMVLVQQLNDAPRRPSDDDATLPSALDDLVLELLQKNPDERPQTAGEVVDRLERALEHEASSSSIPTSEGEPAGTLGSAEGVELSWPPLQVGAPTGRVSLVFTDVEGSSSLWDAAPSVMRQALLVHDQVMRTTLAQRGGYEVKTQGDSFMVSFKDSADAVRWCVDAQEALLDAPWPEALLDMETCREERAAGSRIFRGLRVRMGIYEGEPDCRPDPLTGRMDYFGPVVNRAARVEAAAHGGQILVGGHLAHLVQHGADGALAVTSLGEHHLKGIEGAEHLVEVRARDLSARRFPPPRTPDDDTIRTNLKPDQSAFLGREADLDRLAKLADEATLVTLLGPGGTGKTRLARRFGERDVQSFPGGVWFVDLTSATTSVGVTSGLADALGVAQLGGRTFDESVELLGKRLDGKGRTLVLLDNFEQIIEHAAKTVGRWRELAPDVTFVVTSRIPLQLEGERTFELLPLGEDLGVELFVERCQRELVEDDLAAVREIVRRLDGMPLAIELAAARARILSPRQILPRLEQRLDFLKESRRDRTSRQTNLRGAIDWSWDLLDDAERAAFAQCSVFTGGFGLDAAEEVLEVGDHDPLDLLQSLKEKSLLTARPTPDGELRFSMYATLQAYAHEKLEARDDTEAVKSRHAQHYLAVCEEAARAVDGPRAPDAMGVLARERDNLLAVARTYEDLQPALTVRALLALERLLGWRGPYQGRFDVLQRALGAAERAGVPALEMRVCLALGRFLALEGDAARAHDLLTRAAHLADELDDPSTFVVASALLQRAAGRRGIAMSEGPVYKRAVELLPEADTAARALFELAAGMRGLGSGQLAEAMQHGRVALGLARQVGDRSLEGRTLSNLGVVAMVRGDMDGAVDYFKRALEVVESVGERPMEGLVVGNLGTASFATGRFEAAREYLERAIAIHDEVGNAHLSSTDTVNLAMVLYEQGDTERARELVESAMRFFEHRSGMVREYVTGLNCLLYFAADCGEIETVRESRASLEQLREQLEGYVFFADDVAALVDGRVALAEAAAVTDPLHKKRLQEQAHAAYERGKNTSIYYLHAHVRWLRRALVRAGVAVADPAQSFRLRESA